MTRPPTGWQHVTSLSLTEAAAALGISRSLAYVRADQGRLATVRDHLGDRRVKPAAVKRLLRERDGHQPRLPLQGLGR